jgi:hypothetical protein
LQQSFECFVEEMNEEYEEIYWYYFSLRYMYSYLEKLDGSSEKEEDFAGVVIVEGSIVLDDDGKVDLENVEVEEVSHNHCFCSCYYYNYYYCYYYNDYYYIDLLD